ncbi:MAG: hypothetical protein AAF383_30295 [Cyanobacteria bacterium P01_A01_bin.83]
MELVLKGAMITLIVLSMMLLIMVAVFSAVLVLSTIPKRDR